MGKAKVLVKVHPEGKYVVDLDKSIDVGKLTPGEARLAVGAPGGRLHRAWGCAAGVQLGSAFSWA